jgi:hypothetical protein
MPWQECPNRSAHHRLAENLALTGGTYERRLQLEVSTLEPLCACRVNAHEKTPGRGPKFSIESTPKPLPPMKGADDTEAATEELSLILRRRGVPGESDRSGGI